MLWIKPSPIFTNRTCITISAFALKQFTMALRWRVRGLSLNALQQQIISGTSILGCFKLNLHAAQVWNDKESESLSIAKEWFRTLQCTIAIVVIHVPWLLLLFKSFSSLRLGESSANPAPTLLARLFLLQAVPKRDFMVCKVPGHHKNYPARDPKQCAVRILKAKVERTQNHQWLQASRTRAALPKKSWEFYRKIY